MNNYVIGNNAEREVKKELERQNYFAYKAVHTRFNHEDIFRLFDVIAINENEIRLVQSKAGGVDQNTREAIKNFKVPKNVSKEIWVKLKSRKHHKTLEEKWRIEYYR